ncbi:MAG TPA: ATP-binding protein [Phycisphaerae bacterium]|nr:ATP-binding protein [Phycisphaerae bacterium]HRR84560.1 ATP-binding protein [Phycisphaerae bacterium]
MLVGTVASVATILQLVAVALAVRVWRITGRSPVWLIISIVALLMAARRIMSYSHLLGYHLSHGENADPAELTNEWVGLAISILMVAGIAWAGPLLRSVYESREALRRQAEDLDHRIRELNCLFGMADVVNRFGASLEDIIRETVELIPKAWRLSDVAYARVLMDGREYRTSNFKVTSWLMSEPILVFGRSCGEVQVGYLEQRWPENGAPFVPEERRLLTAIAERLGKIAERHQVQEQLNQHREELARVSRLSTMGEMASSLAHELNQPLAAVANYVRGCQRRLGSGTWNESELMQALAEAGNQAERAGQILRSLRDFVAAREPRRVPADINRIAETAVDLARPEAKVRGIAIRFVPAKDLPPVLADAIQIEQVVLNIVRNALEAMSNTRLNCGEVFVSTSAGGPGEVEVAIQDSGPGLPADAVKKVFDAFYTTKPEGMGIGLSISRSIIEAHRGRLWVTRNEDRGVTFRFALQTCHGENGYAV